MDRKKIIAISFLTIGVASFTLRDQIQEKYLQWTINKSITVNSGVIMHCGHSIRDGESPEQLIDRVRSDFDGPKSMRMITDQAKNTFPNTDDIESLRKKLETASTTEALEIVNTITELRNNIYQKGKAEFSDKTSTLLNQFACETGDNKINDDLYFIVESYNPKVNTEKYETFNKLKKEKIAINKTKAAEPIEAFTKKFLDFVNAALSKSNILDSKLEIDDDTIKYVFTVTPALSGLKGGLYDIGCEARLLPTNYHFGTSYPFMCFVRESGKLYGKDVYLTELNMLTEDYKNEEKWNEVKRLALKEIM